MYAKNHKKLEANLRRVLGQPTGQKAIPNRWHYHLKYIIA